MMAQVGGIFNEIGYSYNILGEFREALAFLEKALIIRQNIYGDDHFDIAVSYNNIGFTYSNLGENVAASKYPEKSISIRHKKFGAEHPS